MKTTTVPSALKGAATWGRTSRWGEQIWVLFYTRLRERSHEWCHDPEVVRWVFEYGLSAKHPDHQSAAASIVEDGPMILEGFQLDELERAALDNDRELTAQARAAAGLWKRGKKTSNLKAVLRRAADNQDDRILSEWAKGVLQH